MRSRARLGLLALAVVLLSATPVPGQTATERERIRAASARESDGDLQGAESILVSLLEDEPASASALLALERVLRVQGRQEDVLPWLERAIAEAPASVLLNRLRVQSYSDLDRVQDMERAARHWMTATPLSPVPYREVARAWRARGELERALDVLREGRRTPGGARALALPIGDILLALGRPGPAVREWGRYIDGQGLGLEPVRERLRAHEQARPRAPALVDAVASPGAGPGRLAAAVVLAQDAGLHDRAGELARQVLPELEPPRRRAFLEDVARRAEAAGATALAVWAYDTLGDAGAAERRAATALRIELLTARDADRALAALARFRARYQEAPELDRLTATVAGALVRAGRPGAADSLLATSEGPRTDALRARLLLGRGAVDSARAAYRQAVPGLRGADATRALRMVTLLDRVSGAAAARVGDALRARTEGSAGEAVTRLVDAADGADLAAGDVPAVLGLAAAMAGDAGLEDRARELRRRIVTDHPDAPEAPAALLALGRQLGAVEASRTEAREYLERLIVEYPRSPLVPQARRALERLP